MRVETKTKNDAKTHRFGDFDNLVSTRKKSKTKLRFQPTDENEKDAFLHRFWFQPPQGTA
jgi:UDP-glucose 4-epimerase